MSAAGPHASHLTSAGTRRSDSIVSRIGSHDDTLDDVHNTDVTSAFGLTCSMLHAFAFHRSAPAAEDPLATPGKSRVHLHRWQPPLHSRRASRLVEEHAAS